MLLSPLFINWHFESSKGVIDLIGAARGAVLGIIFGAIMVACTWLAWQPGKIKKCTGAAALVLILLGIVTSSIMLFNPSSSLHRIFASTVGENRFIFWDIALKGFKERPLLGWGPYTFNVPYQLFYDPHMAVLPVPEIWVDHAHNLIFETMVTGGIILLVALIFFLASIIISVIKAKRFGNLSALEASLIIGALTGWLLQAQFVFDSIVSITMLFLVAGITYALTSQQQKAQTISWGVQKIIFGAVTIVALILFIYTIVLPFAKIRTMISTYESKLPQRTVMWQKFKNGSPMGNGFDSVIMFDKMEKAYDKNRDEIFQGGPSGRKTAADELDAVANHLNDIVQDKKYSYEFALLGAKVSYLHMFIANNPNGPGLDRSVALAKSMLEQSPTNPESYWIASKIEFAAKNNEQAKQLLEQAYKLEPKAPDTHRLILNFAKLLKDDAYYQSSLARAKQDIPSFEE
jgi:hypothetical protein